MNFKSDQFWIGKNRICGTNSIPYKVTWKIYSNCIVTLIKIKGTKLILRSKIKSTSITIFICVLIIITIITTVYNYKGYTLL